MASIDKTYVDKDELQEAITWCKNIGLVTLENGYQFTPLSFILGYNDIDDPEFDWNREEYILWNTPTWFDRWLWINCPLEFVRERLKQQYGEDALNEFQTWEYHDPKNNLDFGRQHYTFLKTPNLKGYKWFMYHGRMKNPWPGKCTQLTMRMEIVSPDGDWMNDLKYCPQTDSWVKERGFLPHDYNDYIWQLYHKNPPTKKSIIRELRRWYIPKGYIVKISSLKYSGFDFEILVK